MRFKLWLEEITHGEARRIVLDAVGAAGADDETVNNVLSARIDQYPRLPKDLEKYSELRSYLSEIQGWIGSHGQKSIQELINEVDRLDGLTKVGKAATPPELPGLGDSTPEPEDISPEG